MNNKITFKTILGEIILTLCSILIMMPVYYFVIGAFKKRIDIVKHPLTITRSEFITKNFSYVFKKMHFADALKNTALITIISLVLIILLASLAGFAIARIKIRLFDGIYIIMLALMVIPFIGCVLPLVTQSVKLGLYNKVWGCILIQVAWNLPFAIFLYTGFMGDLPASLEEAAYIDGCCTWGVYSRVFFPLLAPVTATCCIRCGTGIWNDYIVSNSLLNSNRTPTLMVGVNTFFGQYTTEYGYAFAAILMASAPMIILFICLQKYFIKGIAAGAVKG